MISYDGLVQLATGFLWIGSSLAESQCTRSHGITRHIGRGTLIKDNTPVLFIAIWWHGMCQK